MFQTIPWDVELLPPLRLISLPISLSDNYSTAHHLLRTSLLHYVLSLFLALPPSPDSSPPPILHFGPSSSFPPTSFAYCHSSSLSFHFHSPRGDEHQRRQAEAVRLQSSGGWQHGQDRQRSRANSGWEKLYWTVSVFTVCVVMSSSSVRARRKNEGPNLSHCVMNPLCSVLIRTQEKRRRTVVLFNSHSLQLFDLCSTTTGCSLYLHVLFITSLPLPHTHAFTHWHTHPLPHTHRSVQHRTRIRGIHRRWQLIANRSRNLRSRVQAPPPQGWGDSLEAHLCRSSCLLVLR